MALNKSLSTQPYNKSKRYLLELREQLIDWSESLENIALTLQTSITHKQKKDLDKRIVKISNIRTLLKTSPSKEYLYFYRNIKKLQNQLHTILQKNYIQERSTWRFIKDHLQIDHIPCSHTLSLSKIMTFQFLEKTKIKKLSHFTNHWCNKVRIACDLQALTFQLSKSEALVTLETSWHLHLQRKLQAQQTLICNWHTIIEALAQKRTVVIPRQSIDSIYINIHNPTTMYLRYNKHNNLCLSINHTTAKKISKLCGTHKDGSIHWTLTLVGTNKLYGEKNYSIFYHKKKSATHDDFISPLFTSSNGYLHLEYGGEDLVEMIRKKKITEGIQVFIILECIHIIQKLHRSNRHHMDIKIDNILVKKISQSYKVNIIDIPNNLKAGEKHGFMITAWHSVMPKKYDLAKTSPEKRGILNLTGAQVFHDCYALCQVFSIIVKTQSKPSPKSIRKLEIIEKIKKRMICDFHTVYAEKDLPQTIAYMNNRYNTSFLLNIFEKNKMIDFNTYHHQKILSHIKEQQELFNTTHPSKKNTY